MQAGVTGSVAAAMKQSIGLLIDVELQTHENDMISEGITDHETSEDVSKDRIMLVISAVDCAYLSLNSRSTPMQPPQSYAGQLNHFLFSTAAQLPNPN